MRPGIYFDWGLTGTQAAAADVSVIVDVLSFSTSVCIAVERSMRVYPHRWQGPPAEEFARQRDAVLALGCRESHRPGALPAPSLSPTHLLVCDPVPRLVLLSPNGSTIATILQESGSRVAVGCLRNVAAMAAWLMPQLGQGWSVAVIAAGERWGPDDSLRPALEDQLGAGAILHALVGHRQHMSPEALATAQLFGAVQDTLPELMLRCASALELAERGFSSDVAAAAALNVSGTVPVLSGGFLRQDR